MRILQLISSGGQYGAENMLLGLAKSLNALDCTAVVGVFENLHRRNMDTAQSAEDCGLTVERIHCAGRFDRLVTNKIAALIAKHSIDVVHTHGYKANFYGYWAARSAQVPIVATCHNWPGKSLPLRLYYRLDHAILRRFHRVVGISDKVVDSLRRAGVSEAKTSLIANGIDVSRFSPAGAPRDEDLKLGVKRVGAVGRLAPEKALPILLRAAKTVLQEYPQTEFVLIGDGPERVHLESLARELQIERSVTFAGPQKDMPGVYAALDIFVLPSLNEGMPLALLEAMAAGKPIVASRVGAIPKVVTEEQTGILVEPGKEAPLAEAILRCLRDPVVARALGKRASESAKTSFSADRMARNYLGIYQEVLRESRINAATVPREA